MTPVTRLRNSLAARAGFCEDDERRKGRQAGYALNSVFLNLHGLPANGQHTTRPVIHACAFKAYLRAHPDSLAMHNTKVLEHDGVRTWNKIPF